MAALETELGPGRQLGPAPRAGGGQPRAALEAELRPVRVVVDDRVPECRERDHDLRRIAEPTRQHERLLGIPLRALDLTGEQSRE